MSDAGGVILEICDDFFIRMKKPRLANGLGATFFWFIVLWAHIFLSSILYAAFYAAFRDLKLFENQSYFESLWIMYNSVTSVGFGDNHIQHHQVQGEHAMLFCFVIILGFIFLSTFLLKLSEMIQSWMPDTNTSLSNILKDFREINESDKESKTSNEASESTSN